MDAVVHQRVRLSLFGGEETTATFRIGLRVTEVAICKSVQAETTLVRLKRFSEHDAVEYLSLSVCHQDHQRCDCLFNQQHYEFIINN